jgi:phosphate transport system substrate-binding protein
MQKEKSKGMYKDKASTIKQMPLIPHNMFTKIAPIYKCALVILFASALSLTSCNQGGKQKVLDTPTSGHIKVGIDDSYRLLMAAQLDLFMHFYKDAKIDTLIDSESNIINLFMKDSIETMVVSRELTKNQMDNLKSKSFNARTTLLAYDAIALVINKNNKHDNLYYDQVRDIFGGKIKTWNQIDPKAGLGALQLVFDRNGSANISYFKDKFKLNDFPSTFSAVKSNEEIIKYVEKNKNAIGILSVNWISDPADSISHNFLTRIKVAGISTIEGSNTGTEEFYQPFQAYIVDGSYPFIRKIFFIDRQSYTGLGAGLSSFIAGEKGQTVILRSGMVPAQAPIRIMELKK